MLLSAHGEDVPFTLPGLEHDQRWLRVVDTADPEGPERPFKGGGRYPLQGRSLVVFKVTPPLRDRRRRRNRTRNTVRFGDAHPAEPVGVEG